MTKEEIGVHFKRGEHKCLQPGEALALLQKLYSCGYLCKGCLPRVLKHIEEKGKKKVNYVIE
tara:strand:- start:29664 stop:29849 length:186 start_codon:yes stop_codon:yes gene_type:complete